MMGSKSNTNEINDLDAPLIALTQRCNGDLRELMRSFFSFLHRRTDFYLVPHDDDLREGRAKMGFKQGDAEKLLLASFRKFPLRRIPRQACTGLTAANAHAEASKRPNESVAYQTDSASTSAVNNSTSKTSTGHSNTDDKIRYTDSGLQIPVGNGGTAKRYKWTQTLEECSVIIGIPSRLRAKDLNVDIKPTSISVRSKTPLDGATDPAVFLGGNLSEAIVPDESTWTLEGGVVLLTLYKKVKTFWSSIISGDEKIDTSLVDSRRHMKDYDEATQAQIRKIMFDQNQEHRGLPRADQITGAKPLTPENLPPGVDYIDSKTLPS